MNRKIYRKLAKKHGVTVAVVRQDMQAALNAAYQSPSHTQAQEAVLRGSDVPTPEEFIRHAVHEIYRRADKGSRYPLVH